MLVLIINLIVLVIKKNKFSFRKGGGSPLIDPGINRVKNW